MLECQIFSDFEQPTIIKIADPIVEKAIRIAAKKYTGELTKEESAKVIEAAIRKQLNKPTGKLTKADMEKESK